MGANSKIGWTDHSFSVAWGCVKVSPGCAHCYAERQSKRRGDFWGDRAARLTLADSTWKQPLVWNRKAERAGVPARVFCGSMGDVFEDHPIVNRERERLWPLIRETPWLNWLLLTKRPERIGYWLPDDWETGYANVWLGTSIETQQYAASRLPHLVDVPCVRRFISVEPFLAPLEFFGWLSRIDWVIVGGESGRNFRPMKPEWVDSILEQCEEAEACYDRPVRFFYKQDAAFKQGTIAEPDRWPQEFPPELETPCTVLGTKL